METEKQFLNGMWHKVSILEREELEKARIKEINRKLTIKTTCISTLSILTFVFVALYNQYITELIYPITFSVLVITFSLEYLSMKEMGDKSYGNSNIKSY